MIIALFPTREGKRAERTKLKKDNYAERRTLFAIFRCKKRREEKNAESIGEKAEKRQNGCCRKPQAGGYLFLLGCKKGYVKKRTGSRPLFQ